MFVPGEAGLIPPELAGLSCYAPLNPLMFRLVLFALLPMGLELLGLCFWTELEI